MPAMPDVTVEIAFNAGFQTVASARVWTDVSSKVEGDRGISITRGRGDQHGTVQPSRCSLTLDNTDGRFTPENAAGAYYPNVKKGRPIRVCSALVDTFNRANSTTTLGSPWTTLQGTWGISSNKGYAVSAVDGDMVVRPHMHNDVTVSAILSTLGPAGGGGIVARCTDINNFYLGEISPTGHTVLWRRVGGAYTNLGTSASGAYTVGQTLTLSCVGTTISLQVNGVTTFSTTDANLTGGTHVGMRRGGTSTAWRWEDFTAPRVLFTGYIDEWPIEWPTATETYSSVTVTAMSRMARLGRSAELRSIVEEEILYDSPVVYYPLSEPQDATTAGSIGSDQAPTLTIAQAGSGGSVTFGQGTGPGTDDLTAVVQARVDANNGKFLATYLTNPPLAGALAAEFDLFIVTTGNLSLGGSGAYLLMLADNSYGFINSGNRIFIAVNASGSPTFFVMQGATIVKSGSSATVVDNGALHHIGLKLVLDDATNEVTMITIVDGAVGTYAPVAWPFVNASGNVYFPDMPYLSIGGAPFGQQFNGTMAHVAIYAQATTALDNARIQAHHAAGANGFTTDAAGARVQRYARLAGLPAAEVSTETGLTTSVAHKDTTDEQPLDLMEAVANTEAGLLFDAADGTLTFQGRDHRYGATSSFTLDCDLGNIEAGYTPTLDDQHQVNDLSATRPGGAKLRSTNEESIQEYGYYRDQVEVLATTDTEVQARADWEVNRFGEPRVTVPDVTVELTGCDPDLQAALIATELGTLFTVTNLPSQAPDTTQDYFVEGITYAISDHGFTIGFNTSAYDYADVMIWDSGAWDSGRWAY